MKSLKFYTQSFSSYRLFCLAIFICGFSFSLNAQQFVNLFANPGMNIDDSHWEYVTNDGIGAVVDTTAGINGTGAIITGYDTKVRQTIDLVAIGYSLDILDASPIIRFSDWIKGSGADVADYYTFEIILKDENNQEIKSYYETFTANEEWQQITHSIINYGPDLRSITVTRRGFDAEYNEQANEGVIMDSPHISIANHLINPNGKTGDLSGWTIEENGGDGWLVENEALFRTSWEFCSKSQTVNLLNLGYTEEQLDSEPIIRVWEFYFGFDGPMNGNGYNDTHFLNIELRGESGNVLASFDSGDLICEENAKVVSQIFTNYGPGLREVYIQHGGRDSEYWSGHYGSQVNGTQMTLEFLTTSTNETEEINSQMSITPNVVHQGSNMNLQFNNDLSGDFKVRIQDISGRIVTSYDFTKSTEQFNQDMSTEGLQSGVYMVSAEQDGHITTQRLIIQ